MFIEPVVVCEGVAAIKRVAAGDVGVMVINHGSMSPIRSPMMPAPTESAKIPNIKSEPEPETRPHQKKPWIGIPAWQLRNNSAIDQPRIILWDINHLGLRRFNYDGLSIGFHRLLPCTVEMSRL